MHSTWAAVVVRAFTLLTFFLPPPCALQLRPVLPPQAGTPSLSSIFFSVFQNAIAGHRLGVCNCKIDEFSVERKCAPATGKKRPDSAEREKGKMKIFFSLVCGSAADKIIWWRTGAPAQRNNTRRRSENDWQKIFKMSREEVMGSVAGRGKLNVVWGRLKNL